METEQEESISLEDTLESLKRNAKAVDVFLNESRLKLKVFQKKLAEGSKDLCEIPLQPRTRMMKWLSDRNLTVECSFRDFFEEFLQEHTKEDRLDLSERTIRLNSSASVLFGVKEDTVLHIFDVIQYVNYLYY